MYIDPEAAIKRCLEQVADQKDIVIDMISLRSRSIVEGQINPALNDEMPDGFIEIVRVMDQYPDVQYRYLITPDQQILDKEVGLIEHRPDKIKQLAFEGEKDAIAALEQGPGVAFETLRQSLDQYPKKATSAIESNFWNKANDVINAVKHIKTLVSKA